MTPSIFVWVPRTGGTSIWTWLCKYGGPREELPEAGNVSYFRGVDCVTAMHWQSNVWPRWIDYGGQRRVTFGFCRDTFSRIESIASYKGWTSLGSFVRFLREGNRVQMPKYHPRMSMADPQSRWLVHDENVVDLLGCQEHLETCFAKLCVQLGWRWRRLGRENAREPTYFDDWTDGLRDVVQSLYRDDDRLFKEPKLWTNSFSST